MAKVLITGGAGFLGGHLGERLLRAGFAVRILDNFAPQVHGQVSSLPETLQRACEIERGDVTAVAELERALAGVDAVVHLAATVGVGQSMYRIADYCWNNVQGTAQLLQAMLRHRPGPHGGQVQRLVIASSMSVYGEGRYRCDECGPVAVASRSRAQLEAQRWDPTCPRCAGTVRPEATDEAKAADPDSIYAITKLCQEQLALNFGRAYGLPTVALRFFNIYGPRQALSNPYTGVVANFAAQLLAGAPLTVYEDGEQKRDFVSVHDVSEACLAALTRDAEGVYNVASGQCVSIRRLAEIIAQTLQVPLTLAPPGRFRIGDIRHCTADITRARRDLGYQPRISLEAGMHELGAWLKEQQQRPLAASLRVANEELRTFGLGG